MSDNSQTANSNPDSSNPDGDYSRGFPRKVVASGMLFVNEERQMLLVNPTYKKVWEIPGGVVEAMEAPRTACIREVKEEIGLILDPGRLMGVDYMAKPGNNHEIVRFIFWGGVLVQEQIDTIVLQTEELSEFGFFGIEEARLLLSPALGHQLAEILEALDGERTVYSELKCRVVNTSSCPP